MSLRIPSPEFDNAVAAVCHGLASDDQMQALNELLRTSSAARDEYLLRVELHSRLASESDLFATTASVRRATSLSTVPANGPNRSCGWIFLLPDITTGVRVTTRPRAARTSPG